MHIDTISRNITVAHDRTLAKWHRGMIGERYAFCYYNNAFYENGFEWQEPISVWFTKAELDAFRPNDTVHSFIRSLEAEMVEEAERCINKSKRALTAYKRKWDMEVFNEKKHLTDKAKFLSQHSVVFVKINFVESK